jgi:hypothetical protein
MMEDFWIAECQDLRKGRGMGWAIPLASMVLQETLYSPGSTDMN